MLTQVILQAENEEELIGLLHVGLEFWVRGVVTLLWQAESLVPAKQNRTGISGAGGTFCRILSLSLLSSSSSSEDDDDDDDEVRNAVLWPVPKNLR